MLTWLALEHRLCWAFGMWKVKPQTPPAPTVISLHVPLSKPESHIPPQCSPGRHSNLHVSQAVTPYYRMCSVAAVPPHSLGVFHPEGSSSEMPSPGKEWGWEHGKVHFPQTPQPSTTCVRQVWLCLLLVLACSHTLCSWSRFSACSLQENLLVVFARKMNLAKDWLTLQSLRSQTAKISA